MESFEDVLECSICLEILSFHNKVLPCQHTFCTTCLEDVVKKKGTLECPECRTLVKVEIASLPPNIILNRLLERLNHKGKNEALTFSSSTSSEYSRHAPSSFIPGSTSASKIQSVPVQALAVTTTCDNAQPRNSHSDALKMQMKKCLLSEDGLDSLRKLDEKRHSMSYWSPQNRNMFGFSESHRPDSNMNATSTQIQTSLPFQHNAHMHLSGNIKTNPFLETRTQDDHTQEFIRKLSKSAEDSISDLMKDWQISMNKDDKQMNSRVKGERPGLPDRQNGIEAATTSRISEHQSGSFKPTTDQRRPLNLQTGELIKLDKHPGQSSVADKNLNFGSSSSVPKQTCYIFEAFTPHRDPGLLSGTPGQGNSRHFSDSNFEQKLNFESGTGGPGLDLTNSLSESFVTQSRGSTSSTQQQGVYEAVCDYVSKQVDEISLFRGEKYLISEIFEDGWCRGKALRTSQIGVCPYNHLKHFSSSSMQESVPTQELITMHETRRPSHNIGQETASSRNEKAQIYRCIIPFPASSEFELCLQVGDLISLLRQRDDGWCKGVHHRTGKTGLFPASFVKREG